MLYTCIHIYMKVIYISYRNVKYVLMVCRIFSNGISANRGKELRPSDGKFLVRWILQAFAVGAYLFARCVFIEPPLENQAYDSIVARITDYLLPLDSIFVSNSDVWAPIPDEKFHSPSPLLTNSGIGWIGRLIINYFIN